MYDARKHICFNLGRVMRRVYDYYDQKLSEFELTPSQFFVFSALCMGDGITVGELGERVYLDSSTLTGIIDRNCNHGSAAKHFTRRSVLMVEQEK